MLFRNVMLFCLRRSSVKSITITWPNCSSRTSWLTWAVGQC